VKVKTTRLLKEKINKLLKIFRKSLFLDCLGVELSSNSELKKNLLKKPKLG